MEIQPVAWLVQNEWGPLQAVMVGTGVGMGDVPKLEDTFDPQSRKHVLNGTYPSEIHVTRELDLLVKILKSHNVRVFRPDLIGMNQVFTRDIGLVIDDQFILTNMVEDRSKEQAGLKSMLQRNPGNILTPPSHVHLEGGDIMPMSGEIWVGYAKEPDFTEFTTARTNEAAIEWLQTQFPNRTVRGFELQKSDTHPSLNALHLDCCMAPLGMGHMMYHPAGFKNPADVAWLQDHYPAENRMELTATEMEHMHGNILSIAPHVVISSIGFERTFNQMKRWGYDVILVDLTETAKMGGLLRCSTMPLRRQPTNP